MMRSSVVLLAARTCHCRSLLGQVQPDELNAMEGAEDADEEEEEEEGVEEVERQLWMGVVEARSTRSIGLKRANLPKLGHVVSNREDPKLISMRETSVQLAVDTASILTAAAYKSPRQLPHRPKSPWQHTCQSTGTAAAPGDPSLGLSMDSVAALADRQEHQEDQIRHLTIVLRRRTNATSAVLAQEIAQEIADAVSALSKGGKCSLTTRRTSEPGTAGHTAELQPAGCVVLADHIDNIGASSILVVGCGTGLEWGTLVAIAQAWPRPLALQLVDSLSDNVLVTHLLLARVAAAVADAPSQVLSFLRLESFIVGNVSISVSHTNCFALRPTQADFVYSAATSGHERPYKSLMNHLHAVAGGSARLCMYHSRWSRNSAGVHVARVVPFGKTPQHTDLKWPKTTIDNGSRTLTLVTRDLRDFPRFYQPRLTRDPREGGPETPWPPSWPAVTTDGDEYMRQGAQFSRVYLRPGGAWVPLDLPAAATSVDAGVHAGLRVAVFYKEDNWWYFGFVVPFEPGDTFTVSFDDRDRRTISCGAKADDYVLALPTGDSQPPPQLPLPRGPSSSGSTGGKRGGGDLRRQGAELERQFKPGDRVTAKFGAVRGGKEWYAGRVASVRCAAAIYLQSTSLLHPLTAHLPAPCLLRSTNSSPQLSSLGHSDDNKTCTIHYDDGDEGNYAPPPRPASHTNPHPTPIRRSVWPPAYHQPTILAYPQPTTSLPPAYPSAYPQTLTVLPAWPKPAPHAAVCGEPAFLTC